MLPETETKTIVFWSTTKIDNEGHDEKTNNCNDLDTGKDEFSFTIDLDGKDIQADYEHDEDRDPDCNTDLSFGIPKSNDNGGGRNFGTKSDSRRIPVLSRVLVFVS